MRSPEELLHSRTRLRPRYALFPLEGYPPSRLPNWPETEARILTAPVMGAAFVQYLLNIPAGRGGKHKADGRIETFFYVLSGSVKLTVDTSQAHALGTGGFALVPPSANYSVEATSDSAVLMLKKAYEPAEGIAPAPLVVGREADVPATVYMGNDAARLQTLLPDDWPFDMAMNIFTFQPGHSLPYVETHVMEHGLYFLQGKGLYYLDDEWMEVQTDDFIWMGPYVPQSFYATGPVASKYIYYKNVNRDVPL